MMKNFVFKKKTKTGVLFDDFKKNDIFLTI